MLLDENGFAHITMAKPAEILQLVWAFLSNKCLLKIAGVESHHHTVSVPPTPTKSASCAWHPDIAQPESKKRTNLIWMLFLIMFYIA